MPLRPLPPPPPTQFLAYGSTEVWQGIPGHYATVPFFPFVMPPVKLASGLYRNATIAEFTTYVDQLLATKAGPYDASWAAYTSTTDQAGTQYLVKGGLIYKHNNTYGIWAETSQAFTIMWPGRPSSIGWLRPFEYDSTIG